ncbi:hypothetical protein wVul_0138 [Wolbachia endosymbiont of Armadillidium vulgare str. wVulC]|uniref:hypothetical protein n=1 Tax=Wolbachia endosymbiont of Armadillidium vulgare TaxID=77039 RepID=UPI0006D4C3EE|nr:hypothetical protein [Wolbachia endosymbiont of Armadillidium vulgare]KLT22350.1 hypothetical protein wVul_1284 [Wolbachia endosymbiont of Armadillidium vulgare str. wVulC]KLT22935.1 hypothetical protein wVul_0138 [Wolbachia endosymbiont of Armadillidium vulgare str. wVulC]OJH31127.1 hypothetical protein Wxf_00504 [Wolbachia endosymbiont of Armadillidium vulgare]OJH32007.1 hypothetical protein Wxf_01426 [Wolbachia endosymbiont of Armadillidium vulgare]OJH32564.1 hypothetical protein Wxf_020
MLKSTYFYSNQKNTSRACSLPPDTCSVSDMVKVNLFTKLDDCKVNKSKLIYDKCGKDLKCKIDDKTKNELKEDIKSELEKGLKFEIGDKTENELKEKIKNEIMKDLKFEIDDETKDELEKKISEEVKANINCDILKKCSLEEQIDECDRRGCEKSRQDGEYIDIDKKYTIHIREALNKFYPNLSLEIIKKIEEGVLEAVKDLGYGDIVNSSLNSCREGCAENQGASMNSSHSVQHSKSSGNRRSISAPG